MVNNGKKMAKLIYVNKLLHGQTSLQARHVDTKMILYY